MHIMYYRVISAAGGQGVVLAVPCGYALQFFGVVVTDGIMCARLVFSRQHVKLRLHCLHNWAPLQLKRAGGPIGAMP